MQPIKKALQSKNEKIRTGWPKLIKHLLIIVGSLFESAKTLVIVYKKIIRDITTQFKKGDSDV